MQRYVKIVVDSVIVVIAVLALLASVQTADRSVPGGNVDWAPVLLALTIAGLGVWIFLRLRVWGQPVLGSVLVSRTLVAAGTAALFANAGPSTSQVTGAALGAAMLVAGLVSEPYLRRVVRFSPPVIANLPGVPQTRPTRDLSVAVVTGSLIASLTGSLLAGAGASAWWWALLSALALAPPAMVAVTGRARILHARRLRALVPRAVASYAPEFVVYTSRPDDASYQVTMWLPYLRRSGRRFLIITRNGIPAAALASLTDVPVVEARRISDLDALVPPSLKAAFYVNASSGNGVFVRYQHLTHIYLGHGDSDKPPSYNPTHAMYDRIFAAGPAAARRYAAHGVRIPADKFQIVGRPQVEGITPAQGPISSVAQPVVLYAPTWRGHVEETMLSSLPVGERIVASLLDRGATVIFRPHPFSYDFSDDAATIGRIQQLLAADARVTGRNHLWGAPAESDRGIRDCINASDALVSDVSSVVSDYLFSGKPFAMVAVPSEPAHFVNEYPVAQAAYVVRGDLADLHAVLEQMLGPDPMNGRRSAVRVDYLGDFPADNYAAAFVDAVGHVASKNETDVSDDDTEESDTGSRTPSWVTYRRVLGRVALNLTGTALALGALFAALLEAPEPVPVLFAVLAVGAGLQAASKDLRDRTRWQRLLTRSSVTRAVLVVVTALAISNNGAVTAGSALAIVIVALSLVGESHIRAAWGRLGLEVEGFPPVRAQLAEVVGRGWVPVASNAAIIILLLLSLTQAPGWLMAAASGLLCLIFVDALVRALLRASRVIAAESRLRGALIEYAPQFALYFASTVGAAYQVGMWLPFLARIGRPFIIVTRNVAMMREIAALTRDQGLMVPVIHRPTLRSLEDVIVPSMSTAFYVNNAARNTHFVERRELIHVWLNHGDSEKSACFNPVHAIYDLLFAAGQAGIDRYARHGVTIPAEKFRIVGRPQVESIEPARGPMVDQHPPTVLYAPTWQGPFADTRVYSLPLGREIVERLLVAGARVIFRAHPFNYRFPVCVDMITAIGRVLAADRQATGRQHLWGAAAEQAMTIEDCFNASDAMISDVSAVVSDYLHSSKPFAIVSVGRSPEVLLAEVPAAKAAYVLEQDLSNLDQVCADLLGADPLAELRRETRVYYLGDFGSDNYADGFLTAAREVIEGRRR